MSDEEKGFVVKDKRSFDDKGEPKDEGDQINGQQKGDKDPGESGKKKTSERQIPLPEANFSSLIFSLSSSALLNLGEINDPATNEKRTDLPMAKHAIDTIAMLKEKTEGNLTEEEVKFTESILTDLRWRYVKAAE